MEPITPAEYKSIIKDMLLFIHQFCEANEIEYFIAYGTLLGAIRHGGFIPWDDDIDICMPLRDYEKFLKLFKSDEGYYILSPETHKSYYNSFARVCDGSTILKLHGVSDIKDLGAFIDVFPLINVPDSFEDRHRLFSELSGIRGGILRALPIRSYFTNMGIDTLKCLLSPKRIYYRYFVGLHNLKEKRDYIMRQYISDETKYVNILFDIPSESDTVKKSDIQVRKLVKFEDIYVYAPQNYDAVLKVWYGDYMRLPDEDKRVSIHHFRAYKK